MANKAKAVAEAVESAVDLAKDSSLVKKAESVFGADPAEVAKYRGKSRDMEISNKAANEAEAGDAITTGAVPHPEAGAAKKVEDLEFEGDIKVPGQKVDDAAETATKAEAPKAEAAAEAAKTETAAAKPARKKNFNKNYYKSEPGVVGQSMVKSGEGWTDAAKRMEGRVFKDALPNIKTALTSQLKEAGLPMNAEGLMKHMTETWGASEKNAKALITSIKKNDPKFFQETVEAVAKEEAAVGKPGWATKLKALIPGAKTASAAGGAAAAWTVALLNDDDGYNEPESEKGDKKSSFDPKTGISTVPVTKTSAPAQPAKEGPATKEEIAAHLQKLQAEHPGLNVKTSIMDYMKARGLSGSLDERKKIAAENGISGYRGTAAQNIDLARRIREKYGKSEGDLPETLVL